MGPRRWEAPPEASGGEASPSEAATSEAATSEGRPGGREEPGEREDRGAPFPRRTLEGAESGLIPRQTADPGAGEARGREEGGREGRKEGRKEGGKEGGREEGRRKEDVSEENLTTTTLTVGN